ncbi:MAG: DUF805 domain-containing protein [Rhizobiaceae bacterium]
MSDAPENPTVRWVLFGWRGRIARQSYILGSLLMVSIFAVIVARILAVQGNEGQTVLWGLATLIFIPVSVWSMLAMTAKRLNDINQPATLAVVLFVPGINGLAVLALMLLPSWPGTNRHGPPPFANQV